MTDQEFRTPPDEGSPPPTHDEPADAFPWPPAAGESVISAWGRTWQGAALQSARFFAALPHDRTLGPALLYYLSIGIPVAGAQLFWQSVGIAVEGSGAASTALGTTGQLSPLVDFLFSPITLLISLFIAAGVTHLLLLLFRAGAGGAGVTVRVFAYAFSPQLLGIIPVIGTIAGFVWMVVVAISGLRAAHRTSTARAAFAVLIPLAIGVFFIVLGVLIARAGDLFDVPV